MIKADESFKTLEDIDTQEGMGICGPDGCSIAQHKLEEKANN